MSNSFRRAAQLAAGLLIYLLSADLFLAPAIAGPLVNRFPLDLEVRIESINRFDNLILRRSSSDFLTAIDSYYVANSTGGVLSHLVTSAGSLTDAPTNSILNNLNLGASSQGILVPGREKLFLAVCQNRRCELHGYTDNGIVLLSSFNSVTSITDYYLYDSNSGALRKIASLPLSYGMCINNNGLLVKPAAVQLIGSGHNGTEETQWTPTQTFRVASVPLTLVDYCAPQRFVLGRIVNTAVPNNQTQVVYDTFTNTYVAMKIPNTWLGSVYSGAVNSNGWALLKVDEDPNTYGWSYYLFVPFLGIFNVTDIIPNLSSQFLELGGLSDNNSLAFTFTDFNELGSSTTGIVARFGFQDLVLLLGRAITSRFIIYTVTANGEIRDFVINTNSEGGGGGGGGGNDSQPVPICTTKKVKKKKVTTCVADANRDFAVKIESLRTPGCPQTESWGKNILKNKQSDARLQVTSSKPQADLAHARISIQASSNKKKGWKTIASGEVDLINSGIFSSFKSKKKYLRAIPMSYETAANYMSPGPNVFTAKILNACKKKK